MSSKTISEYRNTSSTSIQTVYKENSAEWIRRMMRACYVSLARTIAKVIPTFLHIAISTFVVVTPDVTWRFRLVGRHKGVLLGWRWAWRCRVRVCWCTVRHVGRVIWWVVVRWEVVHAVLVRATYDVGGVGRIKDLTQIAEGKDGEEGSKD